MNVQTMYGVSKNGKFICLRMSLGICTLQFIFIQINVHEIVVTKKKDSYAPVLMLTGVLTPACELQTGIFLLQKQSRDSATHHYRALTLSNIV